MKKYITEFNTEQEYIEKFTENNENLPLAYGAENVSIIKDTGEIKYEDFGSLEPVQPAVPGADGHVDVKGLSELGWGINDIRNAYAGVDWNKEEDSNNKVSELEKSLPRDISVFDIENKAGIRYLPYFDTSGLTDNSNTIIHFGNFTDLKSIPRYNFNNLYNGYNLFHGCKIKNYSFLENNFKNLKKGTNMFTSSSISDEDIKKIDFSKINYTFQMFFNCQNITELKNIRLSLDEARPNVYNDRFQMFGNCLNLKTVDGLYLGSSSYLAGIFQNCQKLEIIRNIDASDMAHFQQSSIKSIIIGSVKKVDGFIMPKHFMNNVDLDTEHPEDVSLYNFVNDFANNRQVLEEIINLDIGKIERFNSSFIWCPKLRLVKFKGLGFKNAKGTPGVQYFLFGCAEHGLVIYDKNGDFKPFLDKVPSTWSALGDGDALHVEFRILKDSSWLTGEQNLTYDGNKINYIGNGVYGADLTLNENNYWLDVMLDGQSIGKLIYGNEIGIYETGDNSSLAESKVGSDILTIVPEGGNPDGWAYDDTVKGVKSPKIAGSQSTTLKLSIPNTFEMVWGQDSESGYDYGKLLNGAGTEIVSFEEKDTGPDGQEVFNGSTDDGIIQAVYSKDSSGDQGLDAFWIKSIEWINYPPYPTDAQ